MAEFALKRVGVSVAALLVFAALLLLAPRFAYADEVFYGEGVDCSTAASEEVVDGEADGSVGADVVECADEVEGASGLAAEDELPELGSVEGVEDLEGEQTPATSDDAGGSVLPSEVESVDSLAASDGLGELMAMGDSDDSGEAGEAEEPEEPVVPLEGDYDPVALVATGTGAELVRLQVVDGLDYLFLPSYANLGALSVSWADTYLDQLVYAASATKGAYSNAPFDATACATDSNGARLVYVRATASGKTHLLRVIKSAGVRTLYLKSDDPENEGRASIEASSDHSAKATGTMTLVTSTGSVVVQDAELTQIKGRGNSTWGADKKPYQVKLAKKASLLDGTAANSAKTWLLLANAYDDSQLRNYVALKTALAAGLSATPDCEFVELYYDGEYRGLYLLSEKVQVNKGRVEIDEIENASSTAQALDELPTAIGKNSYGRLFQYVKGAVSSASVTGGYLIELDNASYSKERCYFNTSAGYFVLKSPEDATYDQVKYISEYVQAAIDAASVSSGNAAKYFDLDSLARYFLVNELAKNSDYLRYSSTFFYKDAGSDVLHAGPVWDFDLAFGVHMYEGYAEYIDVAGITDPTSTFFVRNKQFLSAVKQVLSAGFLSKARTWVGTGSASLRGLGSSLSSAFALDELKWGYYDPDNVVIVKFDTYAESRDYLADWIRRRITWMENDLVSNLEALSAQPAYAPGSAANVTRLSGAVALDTMSAIVNAAGFTSKFAILVTSEGYWDALTASGIAGLVEAPIVMTPTSYLAEQARAQLAKLRPSTIIVCGGTAAITEAVAKAAATAAGNAKVERCWGKDAVGTAISIFQRAPALTGKQWGTTAFICTNDGYWDALSAAPISYAMHMPIFLTNGAKAISAETLDALNKGGIKAVYIVGGTAAIAPAVETTIKGAGIAVSSRLAGATAIETSEAVASFGLNRGLTANLMGVATTNGYWDALSGSAFCGKKHSVIVLVDKPTCHSLSVSGFMFLNNARVRQAYVFGGTAAVTQETLLAARRRLSGSVA